MSDLWHQRAACRTEDPELFFDKHRVDQAVRICATCAVTTQCSQAAQGVTAGVFAGIDRTTRDIGPNRTRDYTAPKCGTTAGYHRHRYRKETACDACKAANAAHERNRVRRKKGIPA